MNWKERKYLKEVMKKVKEDLSKKHGGINWEPKKKTHCVTYKGIIAAQSEINYHINMYDAKTKKRIAHLACTAYRTKRGLKKDIMYIKNLSKTLKERDEGYVESETETTDS